MILASGVVDDVPSRKLGFLTIIDIDVAGDEETEGTGAAEIGGRLPTVGFVAEDHESIT